jgi:hypothetical protein
LMPVPGRAVRRGIQTCLVACLFIGQASYAGTPGAAPDPPARLKPKTLEAFERYVRLTEERNADELSRSEIFLLPDRRREGERAAAYAGIRGGGVTIERLQTRDAGKVIECPSGLIHHWVGVIFIPGARLDETLQILEDYDHHADYYAPDVQRSRTLSHLGDEFRVFLRFRRRKVITVVLNTEHDVHYSRMDPTHAASHSTAIRIAEVENAGKGDEREKTPGDDGGYLWRMETWWRMLERDGGTYVQCEAVSLTRDIPVGLGWLVGPFVNSIPRESLTFTLTATRKAAEKLHAK